VEDDSATEPESAPPSPVRVAQEDGSVTEPELDGEHEPAAEVGMAGAEDESETEPEDDEDEDEEQDESGEDDGKNSAEDENEDATVRALCYFSAVRCACCLY
jgi:hypothetical protein